MVVCARAIINLVLTIDYRGLGLETVIVYVVIRHDTVMSLLFTGRYFHEFHEKVGFRENITMNSYASVALLQCYMLAS